MEIGPCFSPYNLKTKFFEDLAEFNLLFFNQFLEFASDQKVGFDHAVFKIGFKYRILHRRQGLGDEIAPLPSLVEFSNS